jgi:ABC-2 type transport system permease protein
VSAAAASAEVPQTGRVLPAFALIGWRWISRNPASAIAPVLLPFVFLYFLHLISPPQYFPLEIVGAMLFTTQNIGNWVMGDSATWRIQLRLQEIFVASPLGRIRYLIGVAVSNLIAAAPALAVLAVVLSMEIHVPAAGWAALLAAIAMLWVLFSSIGIAISSRLRSQREVWPVGNLSFTILGMLSPLYYPITRLPPLWQDAARFLPTTYAAFLVQGVIGVPGAVPSNPLVDLGLLGLSTLVGTALALRWYDWRERD